MYWGGGEGEVTKKKFENRGKKSSSRPFLAHPASGQETIFYLRMAKMASIRAGREVKGAGEVIAGEPS